MVKDDPNINMRNISLRLLEKALKESQEEIHMIKSKEDLDRVYNKIATTIKSKLSPTQIAQASMASANLLERTIDYFKKLGLYEDWKDYIKSKGDRSLAASLLVIEELYQLNIRGIINDGIKKSK